MPFFCILPLLYPLFPHFYFLLTNNHPITYVKKFRCELSVPFEFTDKRTWRITLWMDTSHSSYCQLHITNFELLTDAHSSARTRIFFGKKRIFSSEFFWDLQMAVDSISRSVHFFSIDLNTSFGPFSRQKIGSKTESQPS